MGAKDRTDKDSKKNEDDKKKPLLTDTLAVPITVTASEPKPFQLSWPSAAGGQKGTEQGSSNAAGSAAGDTQTLQPGVLKGSTTDTLTKAPIAFGVNLAKVDGGKPDVPKANDAKANETRTKPGSEAASGKAVGEVSEAAESKNSSSGNRQGHSDSASDDHPLPASGAAVKAAGASAAAPFENVAVTHAAAPSTSQVPVSTAQNAYAPTQPAAVEKTAPAASTAAIAEPAPTPSLRSQNIDLKIPGADNSQVDVRVSQRAGDVQVTVRTPDGELAQSLRQHLPELSDRLSQSGASGNIWQPQSAQAANTGGSDTDSRSADDAQTQQQAQQQHARDNHSNQSSQQQQNEKQQQSAWLNELNQAEKETN